MKSANQEQPKRLPPRLAGLVAASSLALLAVFSAAHARAAESHAAVVTDATTNADAHVFPVPSYAAQQPQPSPAKPNIADEVEGRKNTGEKEGAKPADPTKGGRGGRGGGKQPPKPPPTPSYDVTFKTDVPEAEIFLNLGGMNLQSLGKTDADGKLTARLLRGAHNITASRVGYQIQRLRIDVKPGNTNFNFSLAPPGVVAKVSGERPEEPAPSAETTPSSGDGDKTQSEDPLAAADAVVKRYLDAKETEGVGESDWQMVRERTGAALEREPDNPQLKARALAARGQIAYLGGDYANALVAFKQAVLAAPKYTLAHYGLGNAYLATNQPAEAFKAYKQAADIDREMALALKGMGDALAKQGKAKEAAQYYSRAKSFGQTLPTNTDLASARELKKRKRWAQALKEFQDVAATQPTAEVYVDIGDCYVGLEQPLSASQSYRRALELDSKSAAAHYKYGEVMFNLREYASALESLEISIALDLEGTTINRKRARELADKASEKLKKTK